MKTKIVLLVEDNESDIDLTIRVLKKHRIEHILVVAEDGQEALEYLNRQGVGGDAPEGLPALILLDINLPRVNGLDVLRKIRLDPRTRRLPVVILSSSVIEEDVSACYDLGANSYVRKPVDFKEFSESIYLLAKFWLELNIQPPALDG